MKKIAFIMSRMKMGGAEKALVELLKCIDYTQYDVTLWIRNSEGELFNAIDKRVTIRYWEQDHRANLVYYLRSFHFFSVIRVMFYKVLCRVYSSDYSKYMVYFTKSMKPFTEKYDCVICYQILFPHAVIMALDLFKSPKKVLWVHGRNVLSQKNNSFFEKYYRRFDKIFCVSEQNRADFLADFPRCKGITDVCYNVFDVNDIVKKSSERMECVFNKDTTNLVSVGRLLPVKGHDRIPEIVSHLLEDGYKVRWYIIGDGDYRQEIEKRITEKNLEKNIILLGTKCNPYPYMKNCDIYVQPSYSEGYCTTTIEAKILRKPIIVTDVPGMREQFESGVNGLIVDSTTDALYAGIKHLISNPSESDMYVTNLCSESVDNSAEISKLYSFINN